MMQRIGDCREEGIVAKYLGSLPNPAIAGTVSMGMRGFRFCNFTIGALRARQNDASMTSALLVERLNLLIAPSRTPRLMHRAGEFMLDTYESLRDAFPQRRGLP